MKSASHPFSRVLDTNSASKTKVTLIPLFETNVGEEHGVRDVPLQANALWAMMASSLPLRTSPGALHQVHICSWVDGWRAKNCATNTEHSQYYAIALTIMLSHSPSTNEQNVHWEYHTVNYLHNLWIFGAPTCRTVRKNKSLFLSINATCLSVPGPSLFRAISMISACKKQRTVNINKIAIKRLKLEKIDDGIKRARKWGLERVAYKIRKYNLLKQTFQK